MKKHIGFILLLLSFIAFGEEVKIYNISSFLPTRIDAKKYSMAYGIEEMEEKLKLKPNSILSYKVKVKKRGVYKILLQVKGKRGSVINISEDNFYKYKDSFELDRTQKEEELIETIIYLDNNSTELNIELENGEIELSGLLLSFMSDGGIIGVDGKFSSNSIKTFLQEKNEINIVPVGKGFYKILNSKGSKVIEDNSNGELVESKWENNDSQIWKIYQNSDGKFQIMNKSTKNVMTLNENDELKAKENTESDNQFLSLKKIGDVEIDKLGDWKLVWSDEFDYEGLPDPEKWSFEVKGAGWVNKELQSYTNKRLENCRVENGKLIIEARKDNYNGNEYSSARIHTAEKGDWLYGKMVIRAKLPKGKGTWPAIWMMPTDSKYGMWPNSGEIDIMENVGVEPDIIHASMHSKNLNFRNGNHRTAKKHIPETGDKFHNYICEWDENGITISVDEIVIGSWKTDPYNSWENWPWNHRYHIILNIAVGGTWGGMRGVDDSIWPQRMEIDYVRVYQK